MLYSWKKKYFIWSYDCVWEWRYISWSYVCHTSAKTNPWSRFSGWGMFSIPMHVSLLRPFSVEVYCSTHQGTSSHIHISVSKSAKAWSFSYIVYHCAHSTALTFATKLGHFDLLLLDLMPSQTHILAFVAISTRSTHPLRFKLCRHCTHLGQLLQNFTSASFTKSHFYRSTGLVFRFFGFYSCNGFTSDFMLKTRSSWSAFTKMDLGLTRS